MWWQVWAFGSDPRLLATVKAHTGMIPINFTVLSEENINHALISLSIVMPYRYFNEFLVLYSGFQFPDSRQTGFMRFPEYSEWSLTPHTPIGLFLHRKRLLFASHKDSTIGLFMMIHCTTLLTVIRLLIKNHFLTQAFTWSSIPNQEERLFACASRLCWKTHLHRGNHV